MKNITDYMQGDSLIKMYKLRYLKNARVFLHQSLLSCVAHNNSQVIGLCYISGLENPRFLKIGF